MVISKDELLDLFDDAYSTDQQIAALSKQNTDSLGGYAEANQISRKVLRQAYSSYKAFREGKITSQDDDYFTILALIEEHFSGDGDNTESQVAG